MALIGVRSGLALTLGQQLPPDTGPEALLRGVARALPRLEAEQVALEYGRVVFRGAADPELWHLVGRANRRRRPELWLVNRGAVWVEPGGERAALRFELSFFGLYVCAAVIALAGLGLFLFLDAPLPLALAPLLVLAAIQVQCVLEFRGWLRAAARRHLDGAALPAGGEASPAGWF